MSKSVNLLDVLTEGRELPEGCDTWAIRTVHPDGASRNGFVWPLTPGWVEAPGPIIESNSAECPNALGDGICLAYSWQGMASAGVPARTLLLCAVNSADVLGDAYDKLRARRAYVVAVIDGERLVREHGHGAHLGGADLCRADLRGAHLGGAYLYDADLGHVDLRWADLRGTDLRYANMHYADLGGAHLGGADLRGADLLGANLGGADLLGANLRGAFLRGAYMGNWERDPRTGLVRRKGA